MTMCGRGAAAIRNPPYGVTDTEDSFFAYSRYFFSFSRFSSLIGVSGRRQPPQS